MLAEFSVVPVGAGESLSELVAPAIKIIEESGLEYRFGPMSTTIEGDWNQVMEVIKRCAEAAGAGGRRVLTRIVIDERPSKGAGRMTAKLESIEEKLGHELKK